MKTIDKLFRMADFSKETNQKAELAETLFGNKITNIRRLQDDELVYVNAARTITERDDTNCKK